MLPNLIPVLRLLVWCLGAVICGGLAIFVMALFALAYQTGPFLNLSVVAVSGVLGGTLLMWSFPK